MPSDRVGHGSQPKLAKLQGSIDGFRPPFTINGWAVKRLDGAFLGGLKVELRRGNEVIAQSVPSRPRRDVTKDDETVAGFILGFEGRARIEDLLEGICTVILVDDTGANQPLGIYAPTRQKMREWVLVNALETSDPKNAYLMLGALARNPLLYGTTAEVVARYSRRADELAVAVATPTVQDQTPALQSPTVKRTPRILIRRTTGLGDVIMATPVLSRLRYLLGEAAIIDVETMHPAVFHRNPHASHVVAKALDKAYDRVIQLDLAYERNPRVHVVDAYMIEAFLEPEWPRKETFLHKERTIELPIRSWDRVVAIHAARNWRARTFPQAFWEVIVDKLHKAGLTVILVGTQQDFAWPLPEGVINLVGCLTIHQLAGLLDRCACFVGSDAGVLHIAGTTSVPIVGLFTVALPEYRLPWRNGILGWQTTALVPALGCIGCLADEPAPVTYVPECHLGHYNCVEQERVQPDIVVQAAIDWALAI